MTNFAEAHASSTAGPQRFFARWADMATWPDWNKDTEWARLDGPFATGSTGVLKPKGGPTVPFVVESLVEGSEFVDVSKLVGARLTFHHTVTETSVGCEIDVAVTFSGAMSWFWKMALGKGLKSSVQPDLERLVAVAEADAQRV